jgi:hypothetical protein
MVPERQARIRSREQARIYCFCLVITVALMSGCSGRSTSIPALSPLPPAPVTSALKVTPSSPAVGVNAAVQFSANAQVTWSVEEGAAGGTISSGGTYTAPQIPGLYHVIATAVADSSKAATARLGSPTLQLRWAMGACLLLAAAGVRI